MQTCHRNDHKKVGSNSINSQLENEHSNIGNSDIECYIENMSRNATNGRFVTTMGDPPSQEAASKFAEGAKAFSAKHTTSKESARAGLSEVLSV